MKNKRNIQKGLWARQYLKNTELSPSKQKKKGNHDLKWSSPFDCQPKSCVSVAFHLTLNKNRKGKGQEHSKTKSGNSSWQESLHGKLSMGARVTTLQSI